ncbi:uncharacterized protein LOC134823396 [Bolinopsis microptera]|uniref:uncharacterized protein LOC134823396 n=1 Tax=Bolinopsis microptera TaxID=2820187 RepID=UPI003078EB25
MLMCVVLLGLVNAYSGNLDETADAIQFAMFGGDDTPTPTPETRVFNYKAGPNAVPNSIMSDATLGTESDDESDDFLDSMVDSLLGTPSPVISYSFSELSYMAVATAPLQKNNFYTPIEDQIPRVMPCQAVKCHQTTVVVLDSSGSIGSVDYYKEISFIENMLKLTAVKAKRNNLKMCVGLISYSTGVHVELDPCCENSLCKSMNLFDTHALQYRGGMTNTAGALKVARQMLQAAASYKKVAMLITDGHSNDGGSPIPIAKEMRDKDKDGIKIIAVGVTNNVNDAELKGISGKKKVTNIASFDEFRGLSNKLLKANNVASLTELNRLFCCDVFQ